MRLHGLTCHLLYNRAAGLKVGIEVLENRLLADPQHYRKLCETTSPFGLECNPMSELSRGEIDRVIMMAWEDRTSFDAIRTQFGLSPGDVIKLMRREMSDSSFKMWRKRTHGRVTKHEAKFSNTVAGDELRRFRAKSQRG